MKRINGAAFRKRLSQHMDECEKTNEPLLIVTNKQGEDNYQHMVVITEAQYDMMLEQINEVK